MKRLVLFCCFSAIARDPFNYVEGYHSFVCTSMGSLHNRCIVAQIILDGVAYTVKKGDRVQGYLVVALTSQGVTLKDVQGDLLYLEIGLKKGPSTCVS